MYHNTGLDSTDFNELYNLLQEIRESANKKGGRPPALSLWDSLAATLKYLRRNRTQWELAEDYGVSQATVSRAIRTISRQVSEALTPAVPTVNDLNPNEPLLVDGTVVPCWDWADTQGLYSVKNHTTGFNLQVATTLSGNLAWISDPLPGSTHDAKAIRDHGLLDQFGTIRLAGDKGYIGLGMITPEKKPSGIDMPESTKLLNRSVNSARAVVERTIAHIKTWRILDTPYRGPLNRFPDIVSTVVALEFFRLGF